MTTLRCGSLIWMLGSAHGEDGGVLTVDLSSAVAWMRWDQGRVPGVGEDFGFATLGHRLCVKIKIGFLTSTYNHRDLITTYCDLILGDPSYPSCSKACIDQVPYRRGSSTRDRLQTSPIKVQQGGLHSPSPLRRDPQTNALFVPCRFLTPALLP